MVILISVFIIQKSGLKDPRGKQFDASQLQLPKNRMPGGRVQHEDDSEDEEEEEGEDTGEGEDEEEEETEAQLHRSRRLQDPSLDFARGVDALNSESSSSEEEESEEEEEEAFSEEEAEEQQEDVEGEVGEFGC